MANALAQIIAKAPLASPTFTGVPSGPTAAPGTDTNQLATTSFVAAAIAAPVALAPSALDTIYELATASDANSDLIDLLEAAVALKADAAATTAALATKASLTGAVTLTNKTLTSPVVNTPSGEFLRGFINGLSLSKNAADATNDIDVAAGSARGEGATPVLMVLASALTKRLDATWASGSANGGRFDASISDGTWYAFLVSNGSTTDVGFSKSADPTGAANYPAGYQYRYIGSILRVSGVTEPFLQDGDHFWWLSPTADFASGLNPGTSALTATLTVPTGRKVKAMVTLGGQTMPSTITYILASRFDAADVAPTASIFTAALNSPAAGNLYLSLHSAVVLTDTSGRIRLRINTSGATTSATAQTVGYIDTRGR